MEFYKDVMSGKGWLFWGASIGGILGTLLMHVNVYVSQLSGLKPGVTLSFKTSVVLGMIGGLIGGVVGSFVGGVYARDSMIFNVGASMGVGLVNGFVVGVVASLIIGGLNSYFPGLIDLPVLLTTIGAVIFITAVVMFVRKRKRKSKKV